MHMKDVYPLFYQEAAQKAGMFVFCCMHKSLYCTIWSLILWGSILWILLDFLSSLVWPDLTFTQQHYHLQYKCPVLIMQLITSLHERRIWPSKTSFLSMIIMKLYIYVYTWCLRYNICSTWILDIRISTCFKCKTAFRDTLILNQYQYRWHFWQ